MRTEELENNSSKGTKHCTGRQNPDNNVQENSTFLTLETSLILGQTQRKLRSTPELCVLTSSALVSERENSGFSIFR
jgi:hypothetical protein